MVLRHLGYVFLLLIIPGVAMADVLLLLQGYRGDGSEWRYSGVSTELAAAGWQDGGHLWFGARGVQGNRPRGSGARFYTVALPSEAPLAVQAQALQGYVEHVSHAHEGEALWLVGYSVGGVVARYYMVQHPQQVIRGLVTIATPHLGTDTAELGLAAGQSPLGWVTPMLGAGTLNRSQALYAELARERPGTLLFWLNRQPHPQALYVSLIRPDGSWWGSGDSVVPAWSQDMNHVQALRGRGRSVVVGGEHALNRADGRVLVELLRKAG